MKEILNKKFLKGGAITLGLFAIYEILSLLSMYFLGIAAIVPIWLPFLPMAFVFENLTLDIISTIIIIFIIGGIVYSLIKKNN